MEDLAEHCLDNEHDRFPLWYFVDHLLAFSGHFRVREPYLILKIAN